MTTTTLTTPTPRQGSGPGGAARGARTTLARVIHSEWSEARTLRSTGVPLVLALALLIGLGLLAAAVASGKINQG